MSKKSWKDHLLASGLPLEQSVIDDLNQHEFQGPREFHYERRNEQGVPTVFSIDVQATTIFFDEHIWLELLIECKYRHDSTRWVFNPDEYAWWLDVDFLDSFVVLDTITRPLGLNRDFLYKGADRYPLCGKGIELVGNDANPKSIEQAIAQLAYAVPKAAASLLNHEAEPRKMGPEVPIIIPIIVTTAELWRMRPNVNVAHVHAAQELGDIADRHGALLVHRPPDNDLVRYTVRVLDDELSDNAKRLLQEKSHHGFQFWRSAFSSRTPNVYTVVHYSQFGNAITRLMTFIKSGELIRTEGQPGQGSGSEPAG